VSSSLAWVEVARARHARHIALEPTNPAIADDALSGVLEHPIGAEVVGLARRLKPAVLRTLDAIHLASALLLDVDVVLAYDIRLIAACRENGLTVESPGANL
jgi:predicted nucleic acid-binding protein